jgi:hypothetical protein
MLMVIFGAGASYDSSSTYLPGAAISVTGESPEFSRLNNYHRPPLAKELFANRPMFIEAIDEFHQCKPIVPKLRNPAITRGDASIEALLREIEEGAKAFPQGRKEINAIRCYLARAVSKCEQRWRENTRGITNHLSLLRDIWRTYPAGPVSLVTFNYDTILEDALAELSPGFEIKQMRDYAHRSTVPFHLFKLHGSVNWGHEIDIRFEFPGNLNMTNPPSVLTYLIDHATEKDITDRFVMSIPSSMGLADGQRPSFPAIAIPIENKQVFECPHEMICELKGLLPGVTKLILIGWRATEEHFLQLLREHLKPEVYVSIVAANGSEAEGIRLHLAQSMLGKRLSINPEQVNGFSEFILSRRAESILGSYSVSDVHERGPAPSSPPKRKGTVFG